MHYSGNGITSIKRGLRKSIALAVDDDGNFRECIRMMLRIGGFSETIGAGDVEAALTVASQRPLDLIVSDWNMSPYNGLDLLRAVRANAATRDVPFILVTASLSEDAWRGALELGATDFLVKPFSIEQLHDSANLSMELTQRRVQSATILQYRRDLRARRL
ncbi:MAG: response regulator [Beijerinckiaceae bacterium]|nr:response regulator [Beijerinckiaceae bacterium]